MFLRGSIFYYIGSKGLFKGSKFRLYERYKPFDELEGRRLFKDTLVIPSPKKRT